MLTKQCTQCREVKPSDQFNKRASSTSGLQSSCKDCNSKKLKEHYGNNKDAYLAKSTTARLKKRDWFNELKSAPCTDCKVQYPSYVMQWDHLGGKEFTIGNNIYRLSYKKIKEEIAKCELVCANCHAIRTHNRLAD